jgi:signal transduction histidine kinase
MADMEQVKIDCNISYTNIEEMKVFIEGYVPEETECVDSYNYAMEFADFISNARYAIIAASVVSFMLCVVLFIFMICAAGHCNGYEGIHLYWTDKIPFDLFFAVLGGLSFLGLVLVDEITTDTGLFCGAIVVLYIIFVTSAVTGICVTFSARAKAGHWWHNTIIYKLLRLIKKVLCIVFKFVCYAISQLPMYWKVALGWLVLSILEFICIVTSWRTGELLLWWLLEKILLTVFIGLVVYAMNKLKKGGHTIASGDLDAKIDTKLLFLDFKQHAENLNSIGDGMSRAVDERMKSERMKTELITNVSHDIKTPLTSIVNYVDLIKKEDVQPEKVKEYIEVLDRQSARLKKLIEDLVEASKASTGNISVNMQPTDVSVLLEQAVGEYGQKLTNASLTPVLEFPEEPVMIMADGRHLWRVFDNLLGNISKYAMPGTRVYVVVKSDEAAVTVEFKNISREPLNISSDELMERFVRGDSSRNTEGSGLGLSIAKSLCTLMKADFDIVIDGDLYKAIIKLNKVEQ